MATVLTCDMMPPNSTITCARCGGSLERKTIIHQQPWGDELYEFENVPAQVCSQCGEVWLEAEVGQLIDKIIQQHP